MDSTITVTSMVLALTPWSAALVAASQLAFVPVSAFGLLPASVVPFPVEPPLGRARLTSLSAAIPQEVRRDRFWWSPVAMSVASGEVLVAASGIHKRFGRKVVLAGVDVVVHRGEVVCVVGENGSGKTTLLGILAGLLAADGGQVRVTGQIGYCPQQARLFDLLCADEHLVLFGRGAGLGRAEALDRGRAVLGALGFPADDRRTVARELSGGTRQKLNLALALLADPEVLLLDEPYQGFDRGSYVDFWQEVGRWLAAGRGVVVVTHLLAELSRADAIVELGVGKHGPVKDRP